MNEVDLKATPAAPLAEILRPKTLNDVVGQRPLLGPQGRLRLMLAHRSLGSIVFWGPPGTGKTTIAHDTGQLWQKQGMVMAGNYVMASVLLPLLAFGAGFWAVRHSGIWQ